MISQSTIERVKDLPAHTVISHYVDLKKAGANWRGLSPWSQEKTPSFYVVPSKNIFKDFSSGKGGSAITFVMEKTGLSFPDAIKEIADKCGERIEYDELSQEDQDLALDKDLLHKLNEAAAKQYAEQLAKLLAQRSSDLEAVHPATDEMVKRKFTISTIIQWQIGYAPGETGGEFKPTKWRFLADLIDDTNYKGALEIGLIQTKAGHTYDTYRHRVIYPIHNHQGRIVGFGGRALQEDTFNAKYINSPDSKIYKKDQVLFGLHFAHKAIHDAGYAYLTEGYTDVISFHQAGYTCTVGTCGTALTESQCKLLRRYTGKVVLFYDGDKAGQAATLRAIDMLVAHGFEVGVVPMPEFEDGRKVDPDEMTRIFNKQIAA